MSSCKYFICTTPRYPSKYCVNLTNNNTTITNYVKELHNHEPPTKPHIQKNVKKQAITQLSAEANPNNVHKLFVNNTPLLLSFVDVFLLSQLKN